MNRTTFYIPNVAFWNWKLVSPSFMKIQLSRAQMSYDETTSALSILDDDVSKIEQEIRAQWATANVQIMQAFQRRLKDVGRERKRIMFVRLRLWAVIDMIREHLEVSVR